MSYSLSFEIEDLPKTTNAQASLHWAVKGAYVKRWHEYVRVAVYSKTPPKPLLKAKLTLTRYSSVEPDYDGLVSTFKPVVDGLIHCGVIVNDKVSNIGKSEYLWEKVSPKKGKIRVRVEEVSG